MKFKPKIWGFWLLGIFYYKNQSKFRIAAYITGEIGV
jgi:hypothetical protein